MKASPYLEDILGISYLEETSPKEGE
ncbi:uncharacterized protein METZ01_LOCUS279233 [marine metagenome]|uniref:Uncharacterized protein n=1 Tax=marine metagenome TaxID=408172 RepID=A0A382KQ47_9ZZZZ